MGGRKSHSRHCWYKGEMGGVQGEDGLCVRAGSIKYLVMGRMGVDESSLERLSFRRRVIGVERLCGA